MVPKSRENGQPSANLEILSCLNLPTPDLGLGDMKLMVFISSVGQARLA